MIHVALLILAACIVIPFFAILALGGVGLLVRYWYVAAIAVIFGGVWLQRLNDENKLAAQRMSAQNQTLQQQCIAHVNLKATHYIEKLELTVSVVCKLQMHVSMLSITVK